MLQTANADAQASVELQTPPADCEPKIRAAYDYWRRIHPAQGLPGRQHFDPANIPRLLPFFPLHGCSTSSDNHRGLGSG